MRLIGLVILGAGAAYVAAACLILLLAAPHLFGEYTVALLIEMFIFILFAVSLHFLIGPSGILSFGHAAYFGLGAYAVALGVKYLSLPMIPALIAAPIVAALGALIFGWFCVRLSGVYRAEWTDASGVSRTAEKARMAALYAVCAASASVLRAAASSSACLSALFAFTRSSSAWT